MLSKQTKTYTGKKQKLVLRTRSVKDSNQPKEVGDNFIIRNIGLITGCILAGLFLIGLALR